MLGCLSDSVCWCIKAYLSAGQHWKDGLGCCLGQLVQQGALFFRSAERPTLHACLFASVTPLKGSPCGVSGIFFWTISGRTTPLNRFSHQTTVCKKQIVARCKTPTRELRISFVTFSAGNRNHIKWSWKTLLKVILSFHQPSHRISHAKGVGVEITISAAAKAFPQEHSHTINHPSGSQVSQLENVS